MWARGRVRSFGGMNRRKECVPCTLPSHRVQQTRLDVHCTLARVPTVCQNTADDNDNDTLGKGHRPDVRGPMLHGTGSVKAGNACPKAHTTATSAAAVSAWTKESKKKQTHKQLSSGSSGVSTRSFLQQKSPPRSTLVGPGMALRPGRRTSPSARLS